MNPATYTYTGSPITTGASISYSNGWEGEKKQPSEITATQYTNNLNAGTATVTTTVEGKELTTTFKINAKNLTSDMVTLSPASGSYTGTAVAQPTVTVADGTAMTASDYTISWPDGADWTNAGTITVTVTGQNNYKGSVTKNFVIGTADPTTQNFIVTMPTDLVYNGEAKTASAEVKTGITGMGNITAIKYNGSTTPPTEAGTYEVTIDVTKGTNYNAISGLRLDSFTIQQTDGEASVSVADHEYGDTLTPIPVSSTNGTDAVTYQYKVKGADDSTYTNTVPTLPGDYTVKANFPATTNYKATEATADFTISKRAVTATVTAQNKTYNGTTDAVITATVEDVAYSDTFEISGLTGAFSDANAGEGKTVTVDSSNASVTGINVDYYVVSFPTTATATIAKAAAPSITFPEVLNAITYGQKMEEAKLSFYANDYGTFNWNAPTAYPGEAGTIGCALDFYPNELALQNYDWQDAGDAQWIASRNALCIFPDVTVNKAASTITTAPTANTLTYNGENQTLITAGSTSDGTMVYSLEKEGEYSETLPEAKTAGTYHVWYKVNADDNHVDSDPASVEVEIYKADPGIGDVTAGVVNDTLETSAIVLTRANTNVDGNLTVDAKQALTLGENMIHYTFTPTDGTNYKVVTGTVTVTVVDTIAPTGTVSIDDNKWNDLWNTITFGLFFKETKTVKVEVATDLSGIAKVEYYDSATALSADAVKAITAWNDMGVDYAQNVTAEDAKTFIYYIRITDNAGNVTYISTADATYDLTKPAISGITNGSTYYTTQKVTVTDTNLESVTLNTKTVTGEITLAGNVDKTYTIVATDKAGNETTCTVTMKPIASISDPIDAVTESNVNSGNTDAIAEVEAAAAAVDTTNATDAEKAAIKAITDKCDALQEVIADTAAEYERITDAIASYDPDEVTSADKAALDKLAEDLKALVESGNLTDSEKTALETPTENLDAMIETVNEVTEESDRIADAVGDYDLETVKSSDKDEIEQLVKDIDALLDTDNLTDEERTALEGEKTKCENLLAKIEGTDALVDKLTEDVGAYDEDTVKSTDKAALEQLVEDIEAVIEGNTNITEEEKAELEALVDTVEDLLAKIEEVAQAPVTEDTEKVEDITSENVTPDDKEDLTNAKADLEDALTENAGNYTDSEKKAIQEEIDRIDDALEAIENVESVEETISELPAIDTVEPDDEDAIKAITDAKAEYDALTDHEKSLVDENTKKKLDDLCAALVAYDIIKGENGKYTQGGSKGLSFTANGAYSKFSGILVDNKVVDPKHYTAESGSTVITLKASYLDTLSTGKHTLTVVYTDGETSCEFNIAAKSTTPATGDDSNIMLYGALFTMSIVALVVLLLASKKRKQAS